MVDPGTGGSDSGEGGDERSQRVAARAASRSQGAIALAGIDQPEVTGVLGGLAGGQIDERVLGPENVALREGCLLKASKVRRLRQDRPTRRALVLQ